MGLQDTLDEIRADFEGKAPAEAVAVMHRATADLVASGAADRAVGEGAAAPGFALPQIGGGHVSLAELLADGPLVMTFFRGHW
ncbi:MAG: hypothetical protein ACYTGP_06145 [Planctomycetota bacterium]|jgi:hypothetical protein